jgi:HSP20 family protein
MTIDEVHWLQVLFCPDAGVPIREVWQPRADVYRTSHGWLVKFELAGVRCEDVGLAVQGRVLLVQGTRRDERVQEGLDCYRMEIAYTRFERRLELPGISESADIRATCRDGMLLVSIVTETSP